jgi:hypothetical protein
VFIMALLILDIIEALNLEQMLLKIDYGAI